MRRVTLAVAAILGVLTLSACNDEGGGGQTPATTEPAPAPAPAPQ